MEKEWIKTGLSQKIISWLRHQHNDMIHLQNCWVIGDRYNYPSKSYTGFDMYFKREIDPIWKQRLDIYIYSGGGVSELGSIISIVAKEQQETGLVEFLCQKQVFVSSLFDNFMAEVLFQSI